MIYLNGKFVESDEATIHVSDRGLLLGDGVFETLRSLNGIIQFIEPHWNRLCSSLSYLNIPLPFDYDEFKSTLHALLKINSLLEDETVIRVTVTRGEGLRGVLPSDNCRPNYFITAFPMITTQPKPYHLIISTIRRNEYSPITQIKSINYLDNICAKQEAVKSHADEAIFLNTKGCLSEGTVSNIFIVKNNSVITPPISDGLMPGIIRDVVLRLCPTLTIPSQEISITPEMLFNADEVFLTNSLIGIQPVVRIDKQYYSDNNPITKRLSEAYVASIL